MNIVLREDADGSMRVRREPIPEIQEHLKQVIEEAK